MSVSRRLAVVMVMLVVVDAVSGDSQWCQQVVVAVAKNSTWTYNTAIDSLKWVTGTGIAQPVRQCQCPTGGGMGDVTRIQTIDNSNAGKQTSNAVCSGCLGNEVLATATKFCADPLNNGNNDRNFRCTDAFGPCSEVTVYRCDCTLQPLPVTATVPIPLTTTTQPPVGFTIFYR